MELEEYLEYLNSSEFKKKSPEEKKKILSRGFSIIEKEIQKAERLKKEDASKMVASASIIENASEFFDAVLKERAHKDSRIQKKAEKTLNKFLRFLREGVPEKTFSFVSYSELFPKMEEMISGIPRKTKESLIKNLFYTTHVVTKKMEADVLQREIGLMEPALVRYARKGSFRKHPLFREITRELFQKHSLTAGATYLLRKNAHELYEKGIINQNMLARIHNIFSLPPEEVRGLRRKLEKRLKKVPSSEREKIFHTIKSIEYLTSPFDALKEEEMLRILGIEREKMRDKNIKKILKSGKKVKFKWKYYIETKSPKYLVQMIEWLRKEGVLTKKERSAAINSLKFGEFGNVQRILREAWHRNFEIERERIEREDYSAVPRGVISNIVDLISTELHKKESERQKFFEKLIKSGQRVVMKHPEFSRKYLTYPEDVREYYLKKFGSKPILIPKKISGENRTLIYYKGMFFSPVKEGKKVKYYPAVPKKVKEISEVQTRAETHIKKIQVKQFGQRRRR